MDDRLKRRLAGVAVLLAAALLVSFLLPRPGPHHDGTAQRVTIDLHAPTPAPVAVLPSTPVPPVIAAPVATQVTQAQPAADNDAPEPGVEDPAAMPDTQPVAAEHSPEKIATKPVQKPVAPEAVKPAPIAVQKTPASPAANKGGWYVQAGAFTDADHAHETVSKLESGGFKAIISPVEAPGGVLYRVRIGPYGSREQAHVAQPGVAKLGFAQSALVEQ
ncbi:MAG: SPOR domain-containing protein [Stenotrophobium sp.]